MLYALGFEGIDEETDYKLFECIKTVLFNQLFGTAPVMYSYYVYSSRYFPDPTHSNWSHSNLPSIPVSIGYIVIFTVMYEFVFYPIHRLFHCHRNFYRFHKLHHEYSESICIVTHYVSFVEHLATNLLPFVIGPFVTMAHLDVVYFWEFIAVTSAINGHSGFCLPFILEANSHDFHHYNNNGNYGVLGLLDYIFGTDAEYLAAKQRSKCD